LAVLAALLLLANALILQPLWPNWLTGKLSDLAWMVLAPLLLAAALAPLGLSRIVRVLSLGVVGITLIATKIVAPLNTALLYWSANFGWPLKLALEASDLIVLPGLIMAWHIWEQTPQLSASVWARGCATILVSLALLADTPASNIVTIDCLEKPDNFTILAKGKTTAGSYFGPRTIILTSDDGGLTWREDSRIDEDEFRCFANLQATSVHNSQNIDFYVVSNKGIYTSTDGGQTLALEKEFSTVFDMEMDNVTGNLVVAAGDLWIRTPEGEWQAITLTP